MRSLRESGVAEGLILSLEFVQKKYAGKDTNPDVERLIESCVYCIAALASNALFHPYFVQDEPFLTLELLSHHINPHIQERIAWTLSNLALLDYGVHAICTSSTLAHVVDMLSSTTDSVVTSALRMVLSVTRKQAYQPFVIKVDPKLTKLKELQRHELANVRSAAGKLVQILSK